MLQKRREEAKQKITVDNQKSSELEGETSSKDEETGGYQSMNLMPNKRDTKDMRKLFKFNEDFSESEEEDDDP